MEKKRNQRRVSQGVRVRILRYQITNRGANKVAAVVASAASCTMGRAGRVVWAALNLLPVQSEGPQEYPVTEFGSSREGDGTHSRYIEDYRQSPGSDACASGEEQSLPVDSRGGKSSSRRLFLVNGISALVLFDSGATRSFVLLALSKRFTGSPGELDIPLDVEIAYDRIVRVARVHRGCTLQLFDEQFSVDLVPIPLRGNKVIVGINWLSPNGAMIDYEQQLVRI
ncbi:unnamed protein product [Lactuca virosa]|uniref:Reverse transcriptase domain-containing protein n=1 Tax=Lactuca virosa TaxID=75947 RepID=A0AAU9MG67_9ASTR|nr:unnamed protein product [Lactuca virosa]